MLKTQETVPTLENISHNSEFLYSHCCFEFKCENCGHCEDVDFE